MYATDVPYEEAMDQLTQKYMDTVKLIKQSQFEKPYLEDDYNTMEYVYNPFPDLPPANPGDSVIPDCKVGFEAFGILEDWRNCDPGNSCDGYVFTCAHKLVSVGCVDCTIAKITPLEGDRLEIIICSDKDTIEVKYQSIEKPSEPAKWKSFEEKRICCLKETVSIGYTSQQMSCNGTQVLTVIPGGGHDDCYSWAATSGSISPSVGNAVTYTAPASNENCANNPTITLTAKLPGGGTQTATLQLAVNCAGAAELAYFKVATTGANCTWTINRTDYHCDGSLHAGPFGCEACDCGACGNCCCWAMDCICGGGCGSDANHFVCTLPCVIARCNDAGICGGNCASRTQDMRSAEQKAAGCCPVALL